MPDPRPTNRPRDRRRRRWYEMKRAWLAIAAVLLILVAAISGSEDPNDSGVPSAAADTTTVTTGTPATRPAFSLITADRLVADDRYSAALASADTATARDRTWVARRITKRLARRALSALARGDRSRAHALVVRAERYGHTRFSSEARSAYTRAVARAAAAARARRVAAAERAAARRRAAAATRARRAAAARAAQAAEDAASAAADADSAGAEDYAGMNCTEIGHSFTVTPGSDPVHDRDNDGVACESQ